MTTDVKKARLPACVLDEQAFNALSALITGAAGEAETFSATVEYGEFINGKEVVKQKVFTEKSDLTVFLRTLPVLRSLALGFLFPRTNSQVLISFRNSSPPGGSLHITGGKTWVNEVYKKVGDFFLARKNPVPTFLFNSFTAKVLTTALPFFGAGSLVTLTLCLLLPLRVRIENFGMLTVISIFATFWLGVKFSDRLIQWLAGRYPYLRIS